MLLDNGQRSMEAWYFIFSICFFNASRSMFCRALGSMLAEIYPHATPAKATCKRVERNVKPQRCYKSCRAWRARSLSLSLSTTTGVAHRCRNTLFAANGKCRKFVVQPTPAHSMHCKSIESRETRDGRARAESESESELTAAPERVLQQDQHQHCLPLLTRC